MVFFWLDNTLIKSKIFTDIDSAYPLSLSNGMKLSYPMLKRCASPVLLGLLCFLSFGMQSKVDLLLNHRAFDLMSELCYASFNAFLNRLTESPSNTDIAAGFDFNGVDFPLISTDRRLVYDNSPIPGAGALSEYIGFSNGGYFIEVPDNKINDFFSWNGEYPNLISAHRGGFTTGFPENAIETFENTLTFAPALMEVDVRRTADGEWILMHDDTLDRTTTGAGLISETTLTEIQALQLRDNKGNVTDFRAPTLQEALEWAEGRTILELDLKSDDYFEEVVQIITALDAEDQVRFITQDLEQAISIYNLNPNIHLGLAINSGNQTEVFAGIEAAPFGFEHISAFTGVRPESEAFYETLHHQGIVAIQGLFGNQYFFGESVFIEDLTDAQRTELFETVYARGGDIIASNYSHLISKLLNYSQFPLPCNYNVTIDLNPDSLKDEDIAM